MHPTKNTPSTIPGFRLVTSPNIEPFPGADVTALDLARHHKPPKDAPDWLILQAETTGTPAIVESPDGTTVALQSNADAIVNVLFSPIYSASNNRRGLMCWIADEPFMFDLGDDEALWRWITERNERFDLTQEPPDPKETKAMRRTKAAKDTKWYGQAALRTGKGAVEIPTSETRPHSLEFLALPVPRGDASPKPRKKELARKPDNVNELVTRLPNGKADRDLSRALMHYPKEWCRNEQAGFHYYQGKEGHTVDFQPPEVEHGLGDAPEQALELLEQRFLNLRNETVADVIDILFHHWNLHKGGQNSPVVISAAMLCEYRGKLRDGDNLRLHWEALKDAFSIGLSDTKSDLKAKVFFHESKGEKTNGPGAHYLYSPGFLLQYALAGQPLYFAPFLQKVWALDPIRNNEAKRLARCIRADWRLNTEKYLTAENGGARAAHYHSWAWLLIESGIDVEPHRKGNGPKRLIEKMARAVETLWDMEVIEGGGFYIYHPDDRERAENLPPRGALDVWLSLRVCLAPSAKLREALLETDAKRRVGRARDAQSLSTERAKKRLRAEDRRKKSGN